ncbi:hypothetical protein CWB79_21785 [Pseudoalteromonas sp. S1649]|nr:hypothetical protein CWC25_21710 [Pseudoalteromonas sp. S4389]TMP48850.1 hypothetical protein CWB80_02155 [Pseudoalteromonas sp. S1650]TMP64219.1 hypothetical protein CWB79_21785 [Pseudoalteromonas sp. S1649]
MDSKPLNGVIELLMATMWQRQFDTFKKGGVVLKSAKERVLSEPIFFTKLDSLSNLKLLATLPSGPPAPLKPISIT